MLNIKLIKMIEIKLFTNKPNKLVPYDYVNKMHGVVCRLLGNENYQTPINDYVYSFLNGGVFLKNGIRFENNPYFFIRLNNFNIFKSFIENINKNNELFYGLIIEGFYEPYLQDTDKTIFKTLPSSPILIPKRYDKYKILPEDEKSHIEDYMKNSVLKKGLENGITLDNNLEIKIKKEHRHCDITYCNIINKGRVFDLEINTNSKTKEFILLNGIGRSCGIGFGFIN